MNTALSILALVVAVVSAFFAFRADRNSKRSADAAVSADRRVRTPQLAILLSNPVPEPHDELVIYRIRNDGPQDLDSVAVPWPVTTDRITYPLAATGRNAGFAENPVPLGPLALTEETKATFACGAAAELPEFRVRIDCTAGADAWTITRLLPNPRGNAVEHPA